MVQLRTVQFLNGLNFRGRVLGKMDHSNTTLVRYSDPHLIFIFTEFINLDAQVFTFNVKISFYVLVFVQNHCFEIRKYSEHPIS
jgi:hypothetical protein